MKEFLENSEVLSPSYRRWAPKRNQEHATRLPSAEKPPFMGRLTGRWQRPGPRKQPYLPGQVWGREIPFRTHFTKHFRPTPGAWGSELNREKLRRRKIFLSAGEWANVGLCSPPSAHHPTRWFGFFAFSRLHLRWEGSNKDRGKETSAERKGGREIRQESTSC